MRNWQRRDEYLVNIAINCLKGKKAFDLCRSHLIEASQISRGTIYNHFISEADLIFAIAIVEYQRWLKHALALQQKNSEDTHCFLDHHCWRLQDSLQSQRFIITRIVPNTELLKQVSINRQITFLTLQQNYFDWNHNVTLKINGAVGYNRLELVEDYLRGAMINANDANKDHDDLKMYQQFCYALLQLLGRSDVRCPSIDELQDMLCHRSV